MTKAEQVIYVPALRMKTGELEGLQNLSPDVKRHTLPHIIIPPRQERDDEVQGALFDAQSVPGAGIILANYWPGYRMLLNPTYLFDDFGEERAGFWLPQLFELARDKQVGAIPVASLSDLTSHRRTPFKSTISRSGGLKLAVRVFSVDLSNPAISSKIARALEAMELAPEECMVLTDFSDSDLSHPDLVAGVIEGAFEELEMVGRWNAIVFQGTSFPEANPVEHGKHLLLPRNESKAWKLTVKFGSATGDHLVFGDFAADCAKMTFGNISRRPIPHLRYALQTDWFVVRGAKIGSARVVMTEVCRRILDSGYFAGRAFSAADERIYNIAKGLMGPGTAKDWRAMNTTHHITRAVRDIGLVQGLQFAEHRVDALVEQGDMFD